LFTSLFAPPGATSLRRVLLVLLAGLLLLSLVGIERSAGVAAGGPGRAEQLRFMWAMAGQESGWNYYARNTSSGAFGKYQIMPFNWSNWASAYLGDAHADQTPYNQEKVAYGKLRDLYGWLGSWKRVAYWWLTGRTDKNEKRWSSYAKGYVTNIMRQRKKAPPNGAAMPARSSSRASKGDWRRSGSLQKLHLSAAGKAWSRKATLRDGQVLRVRGTKRTKRGHRWIKVLTADGREGWLKQLRTVPARKPSKAVRWRDVKTTGEASERRDRRMVRPRPR
jgi:hypothetical protein